MSYSFKNPSMPTSFTFLKQAKPPPASTAKSLSAKYSFVFLERNVSTATCGITSLHSTDGFDSTVSFNNFFIFAVVF